MATTERAGAVVWAAVSSRPQLERDSLEQQIADGLALCERNGWPTLEVLTVPGESRDYIDLADAIAGLDDRLRPGEVNAYRRLVELLERRAVTALVCRDRSRIGRTDALVAGIEERCRRAGAVVWSMAMPPSGSEAGDLYVSAVERAGAQREMVEIQRRQRYGMDGRVKRGYLAGVRVPFGYRAEFELVGRKMMRLAVVDAIEAAAFREIVQATLDRAEPEQRLIERLQRQFPDRRWPASALYGLLRSPFYLGLVLRRRRRNVGETTSLHVFRADGPSIMDDDHWPEVEDILRARAERPATVNTDGRGGQRVHVLAVGQHEPILDISTWLPLQRLMEERAGTRRPPSRRSLWAGMARCGLCGSFMHFMHKVYQGQYEYSYYRCAKRDPRYGDCDNPPISLAEITAQVAGWLEQFYLRLADDLAHVAPEPDSRPDMLAGLLLQRDELLAQRGRLETMAITGRIDLDAFDLRAAALADALAAVEGRLASEQAILASKELAGERLALLAELVPGLAGRLLEADPVAAHRWLAEAIEAVIVVNRQVTEVRLRV